MALKIEVYSDVICPWCFLGKRRLERALDRLKIPAERVQTCFLPFELDPFTPLEGVDRREYFSRKGLPVQDAHKRLEILGREAGIEYDFERIQCVPNTFKAHRVIWLAGKEGVQKEVVEALFTAYFAHGLDVGDDAVLTEMAVVAGLVRLKVEKLLKGAEGIWEVRELEKKANDLGISGVPHFVIGDKAVITGAQPEETFVSAISKAITDRGTMT